MTLAHVPLCVILSFLWKKEVKVILIGNRYFNRKVFFCNYTS